MPLVDDINRSNRFAGCRQYILWLICWFETELRRDINRSFVWHIRNNYPNSVCQYRQFVRGLCRIEIRFHMRMEIVFVVSAFTKVEEYVSIKADRTCSCGIIFFFKKERVKGSTIKQDLLFDKCSDQKCKIIINMHRHWWC